MAFSDYSLSLMMTLLRGHVALDQQFWLNFIYIFFNFDFTSVFEKLNKFKTKTVTPDFLKTNLQWNITTSGQPI